MPTIYRRARFEMVGTLRRLGYAPLSRRAAYPLITPPPVVLSSCGNMIPLASGAEICQEGTMVKTVLVTATITIIACAAVIAIHELLARARQPQAGPPPRRRAF